MASLTSTDATCVVYMLILTVTVVKAEEYKISIKTGKDYGTADPVFIKLGGNKGQAGEFQLVGPEGRINDRFAPESTNNYTVDITDIGDVCSVTVRKQGNGEWWRLETVNIRKTHETTWSVYMFNKWMYRTDERTVNNPLKGGWGHWSNWPNCTAPCNRTLILSRYRFCNNPRPGCEGADCNGDYEQTELCHGPICATPTTATTSTATTTTETTTSAITTTATTTIATKTSAAITGDGNPERLIILGVLFALSLFLAILLAIFLTVVLRDKQADRLAKKNDQTSFDQDVEN